jgi:hypothetical protein
MLIDTATGATREVDVVVSGRVGGQTVTVSIECRDRNRRADVTWVDEMHTKHERLPTNVLVLVSHKDFTPEALRVARLYGIRSLVLDDVDPEAPGRLFPDVRSLWGKGWGINIDRVTVSVGAEGDLPAENFRASPDQNIYLDDGRRAIVPRRPRPGVIFHSDRGVEYAAYAFRDRLAALGFVPSMNRPREITDNAHMESFFHSMKSDAVHGVTFAHEDELARPLRSYIPYYNRVRLHSGIGYASPVNYEARAQ